MAQPRITTNLNDPQYLCEYSRMPFDECYCHNITSRTVPYIVMYCMDRYRECPVFQKRVQQATTSNEDPKN